MRQTSHFLRHKPSAVRSGHLHLQSKGGNDKPPFNGSTGGSSRVGTRPNTLMDLRTDLTPVPHASLRSPNPERSRKALKSLGVFKGNGGQSLKSTTKRQGDDGRTCLPSEVLGLASCHPEKENCRYVGERPHRYQCSMQASSLGWYLHEQPAPCCKRRTKSKNNPKGSL